MTWLTNWDYRKKLTITGSTAGAQTNYQIKLTIHKGLGVDSTTNVYCNNQVNDDFSDIRFTTSDGETLLDYYIESYIFGDQAIVWVNFDYIPVYPNTVYFYFYYGNPIATSLSDPWNTFDFYEDFETNPLSRWMLQGDEYWDSNNKYLVLTRDVNSQSALAINNKDLIITSWIASFKYRAGGGSGADGFVFCFYKQKEYSPPGGESMGFNGYPGYGIEFDNYYNSGDDPSANHIAIIKDSTSNHLTYVNDSRTEDNVWHEVEVRFNNGVITVLVDEEVVISQFSISSFDYSQKGIGFSAGTGGANNWHIVDSLLVRKYVSPEPNISSWEIENDSVISILSYINANKESMFRHVQSLIIPGVFTDTFNDYSGLNMVHSTNIKVKNGKLTL